MLKVGDDLRQDALILQLLNVMNDLWRREGLDMQMMLYGCISTGFERGLLQVIIMCIIIMFIIIIIMFIIIMLVIIFVIIIMFIIMIIIFITNSS